MIDYNKALAFVLDSSNSKNQNTILLVILASISTIFAFWKLTAFDIVSWDEARHAVNAIEMLYRKEYVQLYYGDEVDTWNAKPPLLIWLITLGYKIFGISELAVRLPSALAGVGSVLVLFRLVRLYQKPLLSFVVCLAWVASTALFGTHIARTGDTDALLTFWLLLSNYFFLLYIDFNQKHSIIAAGVLLFAAFFTKGFAFLLIIPTWIIYVIIQKKILIILKDYRLYLAIVIALSSIILWSMLVQNYGVNHESINPITNRYGGKNNFHTMILYDIIGRFSSSNFKADEPYDPWFLFHALDVRLNVWNYLFYGLSLWGIYNLIKNPQKIIQSLFKEPEHRITLFSVLIVLTVGIILTASYNKHNWYLAPYYPFFIILTVVGLNELSKKLNASYIWIGFSILLIALLSINFYKISIINTENKYFFKKANNFIKKESIIYSTRLPKAKFFWYLKAANYNFKIFSLNKINQSLNRKKQILVCCGWNEINLFNRSGVKRQWVGCKEELCLFYLKSS